MGKKRRQPPEGELQAGVVEPANGGLRQAADQGRKTSAPGPADKPSPAASPVKKASASIDALFGGISKKPAVKKLRQHSEEQRAEEQQPKRRKGSKTDLFGNGPSPGRRFDEEGLPIYTAEELGIGKGGDTAACPFDCDCCT